MKDIIAGDFQSCAGEVIARHKGILDILSKYQQTNARVNRAVVKSATCCGCIKISGSKQDLPEEEMTLEQLRVFFKTQLEGELCPACRDEVEKSLGANMFYLANLCNALDLCLYDIMLKEEQRLETLGRFHLR